MLPVVLKVAASPDEFAKGSMLGSNDCSFAVPETLTIHAAATATATRRRWSE
jgi:hypothetical protein